MANMTLAVPDKMKKKMENFPEINWSEVARQAFRKKLADMELLEKFKKESELTIEESIKLGKELNKKLSKKYIQ